MWKEGYVSVGWLNDERVCAREQLDTLVPKARTALPGGKTGVGELSGYTGGKGCRARARGPQPHVVTFSGGCSYFGGVGVLVVSWESLGTLSGLWRRSVCVGGTRPFFPFFFFGHVLFSPFLGSLSGVRTSLGRLAPR